MFQKIEKYGTINPISAGNSASSERIKSLANLGKAVQSIAFDVGRKKRVKEGQIEGAKAGTEAAESGVAPEEKGSFKFFDESFNDAQQGAYLASMDNQAITKLGELESQFEYDVEGYRKTSKGMLDGLVKNVPEAYRHPLIESINNYITRGSMRVNNNLVKRGEEEAKSELLGAIDTYGREASAAARNGDDEAKNDLLAKAKLSGNALVISGEWTKEQADEAYRVAKNETIEQEYLQIVDDMPLSEAVKTLEEADKNVPQGFSGDEWDSTMARARARLQNRIVKNKKGEASVKEAYRDRMFVLETAIKTGEGDPDELIQEASHLYSVGAYDPAKASGLIATIYNDLKKVQKVWDRVESQDGSIVVDPAAVDKVYKKDISGEDGASKINFVKSVNLVPEQLKKEISNNLYSGDISQAADAADLIKRMEDIQGLPEAFNAKDRAYATQITSLMGLYSPQQAIDMARKNTDPRDKARIESRRQEIKDDYKQKDWDSGVEGAIGPWLGSIDKAVIPVVAKDYKAAFEASYVAGMDAEDAHKAASSAIKRNYTDWNGRPMKHSPEKFYTIDGDSDWVHKDVKITLKNYIAGAPDIKDYYLMSDDRTEREAEKGIPSYVVRYKTDSGWDALRYIPDIEKARGKKLKLNEDIINELRDAPKLNPLRTFGDYGDLIKKVKGN